MVEVRLPERVNQNLVFHGGVSLYIGIAHYSPSHYTRAWIRVLDAPDCYERVARAERKSALYYKAQDWSEL